METNTKPHQSATVPLLPVSNPVVSESVTSQCIVKFLLVYRILLLALGAIAFLFVFMSNSMVPRTPKIQLESFFVSKLYISNTSLGVNCDVAFTIENPNLVSKIRFNGIEGAILYQDNHVATYFVEPFELGLKEERTIRVKMSMIGLHKDHDQRVVVKELDLEEMKRQGEDGVVSFSMQMFAWVSYRTGWWGTQDVMVKRQCSDLRVGFLPKVGFGSWINGEPMTCSIS